MKRVHGVAPLVVAAVLSGSDSFATVIFHNTGTTSGWSQLFKEHKGTISQVASPVFKGSTSLQVTQIYDSAYSGRYHSEMIRNNAYKPGDMGFYGFAVRLPSNWQVVSQGYNLAQFIGDFTSSGCDGWMPGTMVWLHGTSLSTRVKSGTACSQTTTTFSNFGSMTPGSWHRIEIQASWQSGSTGYFKVWFDGAKKVERYNIPTTIADSSNRYYQFRVGIYANGWYDQGYMSGTQGTRTINYDQIGIATTYGEADPNGW